MIEISLQQQQQQLNNKKLDKTKLTLLKETWNVFLLRHSSW